MQKIPTLFVHLGSGEITPEVNPVADWVVNGEGTATVQYDGTCCMICEGRLYKRYDRKPNKKIRRQRRESKTTFGLNEFKPEVLGWISSGPADIDTGHWYGWIPVDDSRGDRWHREAFGQTLDFKDTTTLPDGTYELVGPKIQGNPYDLKEHQLWPHGYAFDKYLGEFGALLGSIQPPRDFDGLREFLEGWSVEGIVWWHDDGRKAKIKRVDFGIPWPPEI